jgi:hypothetical protein
LFVLVPCTVVCSVAGCMSGVPFGRRVRTRICCCSGCLCISVRSVCSRVGVVVVVVACFLGLFLCLLLSATHLPGRIAVLGTFVVCRCC